MLPVHEAPTCSVAGAAEIVGSKWTVLIVHDLSEGPRRFTELERSCAGISPRTLAERLRWLESEDIVLRQSYPESPPRVEYALTREGQGAASGRARDAPLRPRVARLRRARHVGRESRVVRPRSGRLQGFARPESALADSGLAPTVSRRGPWRAAPRPRARTSRARQPHPERIRGVLENWISR